MGLCAVLAARRLDAAQIVLMGHRGDGTHTVLECVGTFLRNITLTGGSPWPGPTSGTRCPTSSRGGSSRAGSSTALSAWRT